MKSPPTGDIDAHAQPAFGWLMTIWAILANLIEHWKTRHHGLAWRFSASSKPQWPLRSLEESAAEFLSRACRSRYHARREARKP
jgi:hypothetical protein